MKTLQKWNTVFSALLNEDSITGVLVPKRNIRNLLKKEKAVYVDSYNINDGRIHDRLIGIDEKDENILICAREMYYLT